MEKESGKFPPPPNKVKSTVDDWIPLINMVEEIKGAFSEEQLAENGVVFKKGRDLKGLRKAIEETERECPPGETSWGAVPLSEFLLFPPKPSSPKT